MVRQLVALFWVLVLLAGSVLADEVEIDRRSTELFDSVMSPYCPGRTLSACPSEKARELRDDLRAQIAAGRSVGDLKRELLNQFGDLAGRPDGGIPAKVAYVGIAAFFILGIFIVSRTIRTGVNTDAEEEG